MNLNYNEVPNVISCKDLDYLCDMFNWNYISYKKTCFAKESIENNNLKEMLEKAINTFHKSIQNILNILNNGGSDE